MNRVTFSVVAIMLLAAATTLPFVLNAGFGKAPQGAQLSQVEASPHYRDGQFHNQLPTPGFTGQKNMLAAWWDFLMTKRENARPAQPLPLVKTDLATLPLGQDVMVWLGHSSWYLQLAGKRILIDPVFSDYAAPFSFINKAFPGDYPWRAEGMPEIDLLIISHDHYDHLDYATIRALLPKIKRVITPLGVGSHLRYWGMDGALITEADWQQAVPASLDATTLNHEDLQEGLIFLGIAGMMDPPRPEAIDAIHACQTAGIRVKMITGDHPQTAMSIGQMLGITNSSQAMTGYQLEHMDDAALAKAAVEYDIFARTSPEHKLRLVKALQDNGEVVGMTGDGVNDAPALRQADVGIAMGIKGTEVTKEAADMVLTDDNFATIASSVKEGRRVYDNLKKTILFIMPTNLAQGLLIIIALLAGNIIPLTPVLILWMNMATSATLSFGLAFEAAERNVMNRPPRKTGQHVMDGFAVWRVAFVGSMIAIAAFILEAWLAPRGHSPEFIRTVLLQMLVTAQWVYMINCRSSDSFSLSMGLLRNKGIWLVTGVLLLMQLVIIYVPLMQSMFGTEALPLRYWFVTLVIGVAMFLVVEIEKRLTRRFRKTA